MRDDVPYLLLTPGPLTTTRAVKEAMLQDLCTWDDDYNTLVQEIRADLVALAGGDAATHTAVLMQGSGTFAVEATIGTALPPDGKLLVMNNGAYGARIAQIARRLRIAVMEIVCDETSPVDGSAIDGALSDDASITHVALVHCETTTGLLNPVRAAGEVVREHGRGFIVDAMSSFGGMPMTMGELAADWLISSANKCIQGVPGFGFVITRRDVIAGCGPNARSLSLDLYAQWREMEEKGGKWRYTSPTHTVRAFHRALAELREEGGVAARHARYADNARRLVAGMEGLGFRALIAPEHRSPIITSFLYPEDPGFTFEALYAGLKARGFVIYPGKISHADTFRIGTIGDVHAGDVDRLILAMGDVRGSR
jgi:2-aminoethylphosphonate-pyruvate transaminase